MKNAEIKVDKKGIMTVTIDTKIKLGPSKSGKTILIATSEGNCQLENDIFLGLNVYTYPKDKK